jgi:uncharacterized protein (TIGR02996 family)
MNPRDSFLQALAENEDDTMTRLVYADWLDEQGEHEEADRQRNWPAAREWLIRFCKENSHYQQISYEELIEFGRQAVKEESSSKDTPIHGETLWGALQANSQEFWKNWSVVTGIPLPPSLESKGFYHWECCPREHFYWFGSPGPSDPDE